MRKVLNFFAALAITINVLAQAPNGMSYQALIRNEDGIIVQNQNIGIRLTILQDSASGTVVYQETQTGKTNISGLLSLIIGAGTTVTGTFSNINWAKGPYFIKTETDVTGGTNYSISGVNQLLSVPYALYAVKAGNANDNTWLQSGNNIYYNKGNVGVGTNNPDYFVTIRDSVDDGPNRNFMLIQNTSTSQTSSVALVLQAGNSSNSVSVGHWAPTYNSYPNLLNNYGFIYSHALVVMGDTMRFMSNGHYSNPPQEWLRINNVGNIGIGTTNPPSKLTVANGDVYLPNSNNGIILTSPNGQCWRVTVDNNGNLTSASIPCP